jgi:1,2-diacylglycerol 3-alpha-glucosyltransferase
LLVNRKMRTVVHVITKFAHQAWAGAENSIVEISKRLPGYGFKSEVYSILAFSDQRRETIAGIGVRRFRGFYTQPGRLRPMSHAEGQLSVGAVSPALLWSLATNKDVAIVHLHCHERLTTSAAHVCWRRKLPYLYTIHSFYDPSRHAPLLGLPGLSYEWGVRRANRVITVGPRELRTLKSVYPDRARNVLCIPNGVDAEVFGAGDAARFRREYEIPREAALLVHVGRIYGLKNQLYSVRLLAETLRRGADVVLALIGPVFDEAYFRALNSEIDRQELRPRVRLVGGLEPGDWRLASAYRAADLVLLPSEDEAQGLVLLEAWAAGAGVLASNIENLRKFIVPGVTGELLPQDWSLPEAAETVKAMIANRVQYREGTRKAAEKYNWDATAKQIAGCYEDMLEQAGARTPCM